MSTDLNARQKQAILEMPQDGSMVFEFRRGLRNCLFVLNYQCPGLLEECHSVAQRSLSGKYRPARRGYRLSPAGQKLRAAIEAGGLQMTEATEALKGHYPQRYGSIGFPRRPDYKRCCKEVLDRGSSWPSRFVQCSRSNGHGPDGAYCKQHDPERATKRSAQ